MLIHLDRPARVPPELAQLAGLTDDKVQISEKYGGGFPANVEGLHHLHCLVRIVPAFIKREINYAIESPPQVSLLQLRLLSCQRRGRLVERRQGCQETRL